MRTSIVDLAASWHVLEIVITIVPADPGSAAIQLADARMVRAVHVLSAPSRGAVSFGARGGCRCLEQPLPTPSPAGPGTGWVAACVVRAPGWEGAGDEAGQAAGSVSQLNLPLVPGARAHGEGAEDASAVYGSAMQVAEIFDLGRIEALQIWQAFDAYIAGRADAPVPVRRWAVISANGNADYAFYLPVVAYVWQRIIGYTPLVLLIGTVWQDPPPDSRHAVVLRTLTRLAPDIKLRVVPCADDVNTAAAAQVARLYSCLVEGVGPEDFLLTTDADLVPLSRAHFNQDRRWDRPVHLYNSFCCAPLLLPEGGLAQAQQDPSRVALAASDIERGAGVDDDHRLLHLPISYAGARASDWRDIMALSEAEEHALREQLGADADLLRLAVESRLVHDLGAERAAMNLADNHRHADMDMWHLDQRILSAKLGGWSGFPQLCELTPRFGHRDRVDRMNWSVPSTLEGFVDAHLPQPGFTDGNWAGTRALLELLSHEAGGAAVAEEMMAWMDEYHAGFVAALVDDL